MGRSHSEEQTKKRLAHNAEMRVFYAKRKASVRELKRGLSCLLCGEADPRCLQWHHVRGEKSFTIGKIGWRKSIKDLEAEIAKCDLLCANCHIKEHLDEDDYMGY